MNKRAFLKTASVLAVGAVLNPLAAVPLPLDKRIFLVAVKTPEWEWCISHGFERVTVGCWLRELCSTSKQWFRCLEFETPSRIIIEPADVPDLC